ncbi:methyltransferase family protein [bacterium]
MEKGFSAIVFKNRRFIAIAAYAIPIALKHILHGTTSMQFLITGFIVVVLGMTLRMVSAGYLLGQHIVTEVGADYLCASGPFAHIRNPLYVGNMTVGIGVGVALNEWYGYLIIVLAYICMYIAIIPLEEQFLEEKFGKAFDEYKKHVKRLIPNIKGYKCEKAVACDLKKGFNSEKYFILILLIAFLSIYFLFVR